MEKIFYDEKGTIQKIKIDKLLKKGLDTETYKTTGNECLKVFRNLYEDEMLFKILSKLDLNNFYKINKLLYDKDNNFMAYTARFYKKEDIDILTMPVDYTIENMNRLYKVSSILSSNNIRIEDLHHKNVILDNNNITIIDADRYIYDPNNEHKDYNKRFINTLFVLLYMTSSEINQLATNQNYYDMVTSIRQLFAKDNNPDIVSKKLVKYKYPIDYLKNNI